ncbi:TPA: hypothetical protein ACWLUJ_005738 [Pseudomonas aeruginosa]|nr:type IA DNA topoisomerase [Pseudomonas aeruginosa]
MSKSKPSIVLVMEKPYSSRVVAPFLKDRWPGHKVFVIYTFYLGLYEFRYPRGLTFASLPYISAPDWRPRKFDSAHPPRVVELLQGEVRPTRLEPSSVLAEADEIWFACDPDSSGAIAYHVLLSQCLGEEVACLERPALVLHSLDTASIQRGLDNPSSTTTPFFQACLSAGQAKRFFDFNYNVNSLVLFGECLRRVGVSTERFAMSKYSLQLLYALQGQEPLSEINVLSQMHQWRGSGRYEPSKLGSAASMGRILSGLLSADLLAEGERGIALSSRGSALLKLLHPDCADPDLPARLETWQCDWPSSREKMCRYLRTFFGKQARYIRAL